MNKIEVICKMLKEYNGDFASDIVQKELKDMLNVVGVNFDDFDLEKAQFSKPPYEPTMLLEEDDKSLKIYQYGSNRLHIDYVDNNREYKTFSVIHNDKIFARVIGDIVHTKNGDYIYHLHNCRNYFGESFINDGRFDVMYSAVQHTLGRAHLKEYSSESLKSGTGDNELIEFVMPSNYTMEDLIKFIRMFESHPKEVSEFIKGFKIESNKCRKVNYLAYDSNRDYWYRDGKLHLLLKPNSATLSTDSSRNGEIYEMNDQDIEYFKQFDDIDLDIFIPWTEKKKALAKRL